MKLERTIILASSSPRRQFLMKETGFEFIVEKPDVDEIFPNSLPVDQVARYLATLKAEHFRPRLRDEIVVTADTVVILDGRILNKPLDGAEASAMLSSLSGRTHRVMTGVCILSREKELGFDDTTHVTFESLTQEEIDFYIEHYKPFDKAGAYGAQDCLPPGMNPCSAEEIAFVEQIGKTELISNTITRQTAERRIAIIRKISGSYFNVMGFPIHKVYEHLRTWSDQTGAQISR